jgi:hypothetical protein
VIDGHLNAEFVSWSIARGLEREKDSRQLGLQEVSHSGGVSGSFDPEGRVGEDTIAAIFGFPYPPIGGGFKTDPDVGPMEVEAVLRQTESTKTVSLLIRKSDGPLALARPYVCIELRSPDGTAAGVDYYRIHGWMTGKGGWERGVKGWWGGRDNVRVVDLGLLYPFDPAWYEWLDTHREMTAVRPPS